MKRYSSLIIVHLLPLSLIITVLGLHLPPDPTDVSANLPIIENVGQFNSQVRFQIMAQGQTLWLTDNAIWFSGDEGKGIKLNFASAVDSLKLEALARHNTRISYYSGRDSRRWFEAVPVWSAVDYLNVDSDYKLRITSEGQNLYSEILPLNTPSSLPPVINLQLEGAEQIWLEESVLHLQAGKTIVTFPLPDDTFTWKLSRQSASSQVWDITGVRNQPAVSLQSQMSHILISNLQSLNLQSPNRQSPTTTLHYGTYLGGTLWDEGQAIAVDSQNRIVVAGHTQSLDFPGGPGASKNARHAIEGFIARFSPDGANLEYMVLFWGDVEDWVNDIALDADDNVYAVGETDSSDFPTTPGAFQPEPVGGFDAFVVKIDNSGNLLYATHLGASDTEQGRSIAVDSAGNAYVTGGTWSADFPVTTNAYNAQINGQRDIFISKLNPDGSQLEYSTFVGGSGQEQAEAIALNEEDNVHLGGWTRSDDFPATPNVVGPELAGVFDAFVLQLSFSNAISSTLNYATYLGGINEDRALALALDANGNPIISGRTHSADFLTTPNAFNTSYGGGTCDFSPCPDVFVSKLMTKATVLAFSGFLGGNNWDTANDLSLDANENIYLNGQTYSANFPTTGGAWQTQRNGERDAFVARLDRAGTDLTYSSYYGGSNWDDGNGIAVGSNNLVYLTGKTRSTDFPVTVGAYSTTLSGDFDAYALVLQLPLALTGTGTLPLTPTPTPTITPTTTPVATATSTPLPNWWLFLPLVLK